MNPLTLNVLMVWTTVLSMDPMPSAQEDDYETARRTVSGLRWLEIYCHAHIRGATNSRTQPKGRRCMKVQCVCCWGLTGEWKEHSAKCWLKRAITGEVTSWPT